MAALAAPGKDRLGGRSPKKIASSKTSRKRQSAQTSTRADRAPMGANLDSRRRAADDPINHVDCVGDGP